MNQLKEKNFCYLMISVFFLCFNSGLLNGVTIIDSGYTTCHMTGNLSYIGYHLADKNTDKIVNHFLLWVSYITGGIISGIIIPKESFHLKRSYGKVLFLMLINIVIIYIIATLNCKYYIFFSSLGSGMQNAISTRYSKKVIRTTHLTGCSTDISLNIAHILKGNKEDTWVLNIFIPQIFFFICGVFVSVIGFHYFQFKILLLNLLIIITLIMKHAMIISTSYEIPFSQALVSF